jgi:hypothetical protein
MKSFIVFLIFLTLPFFYQGNNTNFVLLAQEEEILEEESTPKKEKEQVQEKEKKQELEEFEESDKGESKIPDRLRYYKEKYEATYQNSFESVWNAVKQSIIDLNCMIAQEKYSQTDDGFFKGKVESDYCVFSVGLDSTFDVLKRYSLELPLIRGGRWMTGRMKYVFNIEEKSDGSVYLLLRGEISGFENYVTHRVHFWKSNGYWETYILNRIKEKLTAVKNE